MTHLQRPCSKEPRGQWFFSLGWGGAVQKRLSFGNSAGPGPSQPVSKALEGRLLGSSLPASLGPSTAQAQDTSLGHCNTSQLQRPRALPPEVGWRTARQSRDPSGVSCLQGRASPTSKGGSAHHPCHQPHCLPEPQLSLCPHLGESKQAPGGVPFA